MSSFTLNINSSQIANADSGDFTVKMEPPIYLGKGQYEVSLVSCNLWYSYPNVSATEYNNAKFTYSPDSGVTFKDVDFPTGTYTITDLNSYLHDQLILNGDYDTDTNGIPSISFTPNFNTLKVEIEITEATFQVDLSTSNFYKLFGFSDTQAASILTASAVGDNIANINNDVNKLVIGTSLLGNSLNTYDNSVKGTTLYSFIPDSAPGSNVLVQPAERLYIPMNNAYQIFNVRMYIQDNLGRRLDFRGEPVSYLIHIREIK